MILLEYEHKNKHTYTRTKITIPKQSNKKPSETDLISETLEL